MDLKEIQERNYQATVKRGLITKTTCYFDFFEKLTEETKELQMSVKFLDIHKYPWDIKFDEKELADIIIVCLNMAKHLKIDIQKALKEKTLYNEKRKD